MTGTIVITLSSIQACYKDIIVTSAIVSVAIILLVKNCIMIHLNMTHQVTQHLSSSTTLIYTLIVPLPFFSFPPNPSLSIC